MDGKAGEERGRGIAACYGYGQGRRGCGDGSLVVADNAEVAASEYLYPSRRYERKEVSENYVWV